MLKSLTACIIKNCGSLEEMGIPDNFTCLLRDLYASQEATVRNGNRTDLFQIGKKGTKRLYIITPQQIVESLGHAGE